MNYIETFTGRRFEPLAPRGEDVDIRDIAHALSQQCRFSGHTRRHYSVAEHSVRVCNVLENRGEPRRVVLAGLLHDTSEAYLVDVPAPLKAHPSFAFYRDAEDTLTKVIVEHFGCAGAWVFGQRAIKAADATLLATEARDLMPFRPAHWGALQAQPLAEVISPWAPWVAEERFLAKFALLTSAPASRRDKEIA